MDESEKTAKFREQTEALYAALGRFAVNFEHVCHNMVTVVSLILHQDGLRSQSLANCLLADLTADALRRVFGAVVAEVRKDDNDEIRALDNVLSRTQRLTQQRNDVIHRMWFIGWASPDQEDFAKASSWKFKNTKRGAEFQPREYSVAEFDELSEHADEIAAIIERMGGCIGTNKSFVRNFHIEKDGTVRLPRKT